MAIQDNRYGGGDDRRESDRDHGTNPLELGNLDLGPARDTDQGAEADKDTRYLSYRNEKVDASNHLPPPRSSEARPSIRCDRLCDFFHNEQKVNF
jgi:hypothetical protein